MDVAGTTFWSLIWTVLAILVSLAVVYVWKTFQIMKDFEKHNVPYRKPLRSLTGMISIIRQTISVSEMIVQLYQEFPGAKYSGTFEFTSPTYVLRDPELIKSITVKNFDHFSDHKGFFDTTSDPLFGGNLFFMTGEQWKEMRTIISPVFTSSKMKAMFELMRECAEDFTIYLEKQPQPLTIEMKDIFTRYTNDVIATTAFGISVNSLENKENEFYMMGKEATNFTGLRVLKAFLFSACPPVTKLFRLKFIPPKVTNFFCDLVKDAILTRRRDGITRPDLIHQLMQAKHKESNADLTFMEITAQAFIFFFAGFDTSSTLMCFACHQLAVHQDMQERLVAEIDAAFDKGDKLSYEKVNHLQYLEMFLNETLRYYPPMIFTDRVNTQEFELPPANETAKPVLLKPGSRLSIPIFAIHRDSKLFPNPEKFDPERFSPENKGSINPFAFLPFGAGPRSCPANRFALMETKLVLCSILRKFHIHISAKTQIPLVLSKNTPSISSENGFWLDFKPRDVVAH